MPLHVQLLGPDGDRPRRAAAVTAGGSSSSATATAARTDDGLGWQRGRCRSPPTRGLADADVITLPSADPRARAGHRTAPLVVFIDAGHGDTPGCVSVRAVAPAPGASWVSTTCGRKTSSGLPMRCSAQRRQVLLVTVTGAHFGYGTQLSPAVSDCMSKVLTIVEAALDGR